MRPQEYLVLPIDALQANSVRITQALDRSNKFGPPKTRAGRRFIPVSETSLDMARYFAEKYGTDGFVFSARRKGGYQRYNNFLRRGWHKLMEEAGFVEEEVVNGLIFLKMADEYAKPPYNRDVGIPPDSSSPPNRTSMMR